MRRQKRNVGTKITVQLSADLLGILDRFIKEEVPSKTRSEVLAHAFEDWAIGMGYQRWTESDD
jgi:metal-responsive CopG/Arc/MetJ family transcriptional regulator